MVIVGLGNIGRKYELTHHNVGFMALDLIAKSNNFTFSEERKFQAYIYEYFDGKNKHFFVKPTTYMNNSGIAISSILKYYKLDAKDLFVIYDDLDLPLGDIRIRKNGSSGGHNGIKSIIEHLGTQEFSRLRIGIKKQREIDTIDYVLSNFSKGEMPIIQATLEKVPNIIDDLLKYGIDYIMNHYN